MNEEYEDYDVFATYLDGSEECVGTLYLPIIKKDSKDMPQELEVNGVVYYPLF